MKQFTKNELDELSRLWDDLSRLSVGLGPPQTDDEVIEAGLDAFLTGVVSSEGEFGREGLDMFKAIQSYRARSPALKDILARLEVLLGLSHES
jgi:hypothetical protein